MADESHSTKTIICVDCGTSFPKTRGAQKRCRVCQKLFKHKNLLEYKRQRSRDQGRFVAGSIISCDRCGTSCEAGSAKQRFCKPCAGIRTSELRRGYLRDDYEKNKERRRAYARAHYQKIKEKLLADRSTPEGRAKINAQQSRRYARNPMVRLNMRMSSGINGSLRGTKNRRAWQSLVGYTASELKIHLERQFSKGMTWENQGMWEIDHIRPLASFNFEHSDDQQFQEAWAMTNLRPLWKPENRSKKDKRIFLI